MTAMLKDVELAQIPYFVENVGENAYTRFISIFFGPKVGRAFQWFNMAGMGLCGFIMSHIAVCKFRDIFSTNLCNCRTILKCTNSPTFWCVFCHNQRIFG